VKQYKPLLAITMGDPAGIGPEIALKAAVDRRLQQICRPLLIGNAAWMEKTLPAAGVELRIRTVRTASEAAFVPGTLDVLDLPLPAADGIIPGRLSAAAGDIAYRCILKAIGLARSGEADGVVTNPVHKKAINDAGHPFPGHTEIFARQTGTAGYAMLLADDKLRVIHVSTHVSLRQACDLVKKERIFETIGILNDGLKLLGIARPRIGVAGLNPHAGEEGLFGDEEMLEIRPAIEQALSLGIDVAGPVPPDALYAQAAGGKFDGCVAMYHDQGHIPFKMHGFSWDQKRGAMRAVKGVNITLGLPVIRTSVDHGTAFEIAGKGIASPGALLQAVDYAVVLCRNRSDR